MHVMGIERKIFWTKYGSIRDQRYNIKALDMCYCKDRVETPRLECVVEEDC